MCGAAVHGLIQTILSYHNRGHGRDHSWQSRFTVEHPEYLTVDRSREKRQWGVLSLAYPEVRDHLCERFSNLLEGTASTVSSSA